MLAKAFLYGRLTGVRPFVVSTITCPRGQVLYTIFGILLTKIDEITHRVQLVAEREGPSKSADLGTREKVTMDLYPCSGREWLIISETRCGKWGCVLFYFEKLGYISVATLDVQFIRIGSDTIIE